MAGAYSIKVRGVVQGVGFRPFVYQLAHANRLAGWVLNGEEGVEIHVEGRERSVESSSVGRLFDTAAALLGFTREITFEGQAAVWLEQLASGEPCRDAYPFPFSCGELDLRPLLNRLICDRLAGRNTSEIARAFYRGIAGGVCDALLQICSSCGVDMVVLSGGVFQNELLLGDIGDLLKGEPLQIWTNHQVPANDGGISLGQVAIAACAKGTGSILGEPTA